MSFRAKKPVFFGILSVFIIFSLTNCFDVPENIGEVTYTNVEYSEDGKTITIYMDGSAPVRVDRALSQRLARLGHDFFEVTFLYNTDGTAANYKIAKASWELGEPAGITDVYRTETGIDYYPPPPNTVGVPTTGIPPVNYGSVVLFIGKKSDKTLLAIGTLSAIDGVSVTNVTKPLIRTTTRKISFDVNALQAGVSRTYSASSFKITTTTSPAQPATLTDIYVGGKPFPYFPLPVGFAGNATYTFNVSSSTHPFSFYAPAIIYAGGATCENITPKYTLPAPNGVKSDSEYEHSTGSTVVFNSLPAVNAPFPSSGTVGFRITTAVDKTIFAITFEIPVYAIYSTPESVQWKLKPGYDLYAFELDNGRLENGGAILIGVGNIEGDSTNGLIKVGDAIKYNNVTGINFNLNNFEIYFKIGTTLQNLTPADNANYPNYSGWTNLTFYYDNSSPLDNIAETQMTGTVPLPYGKVLIRVVYEPSPGEIYQLEFYVQVNNVSSFPDIPYENRFVIAKPNDWVQALNGMTSGGNYLFVFTENVNLPTHARSLSANYNIFLVATTPDLTIGRAGTTTFNDVGNRTANIFIGEWPFNDPAFAGGDVIIDYPFKFNATGTWEAFGTTGTASYMFVRGTNPTTGNVIVNVLGGIWDDSEMLNGKEYLAATIVH